MTMFLRLHEYPQVQQAERACAPLRAAREALVSERAAKARLVGFRTELSHEAGGSGSPEEAALARLRVPEIDVELLKLRAKEGPAERELQAAKATARKELHATIDAARRPLVAELDGLLSAAARINDQLHAL